MYFSGTLEERGILSWKEPLEGSKNNINQDTCLTYDLPFVTKWLRKKQWARYVPILPTLDEDIFHIRKCRSRICSKKELKPTYV